MCFSEGAPLAIDPGIRKRFGGATRDGGWCIDYEYSYTTRAVPKVVLSGPVSLEQVMSGIALAVGTEISRNEIMALRLDGFSFREALHRYGEEDILGDCGDEGPQQLSDWGDEWRHLRDDSVEFKDWAKRYHCTPPAQRLLLELPSGEPCPVAGLGAERIFYLLDTHCCDEVSCQLSHFEKIGLNDLKVRWREGDCDHGPRNNKLF